MSVIYWIIRILVILFLIRLAVLFVRGMLAGGGKGTGRGRSPKAPERIGGKLVQDPQCGTYVPEERAIKTGRGEQAVFFCSPECRDVWLTRREGKAAAN